MKDQVCEQLLLDPYLDPSGIVVKVSKGRVTLTGTVPSERMRDGAVAAASSVVAGAVDAKLQVAGATGRASRVTPRASRVLKERRSAHETEAQAGRTTMKRSARHPRGIAMAAVTAGGAAWLLAFALVVGSDVRGRAQTPA